MKYFLFCFIYSIVRFATDFIDVREKETRRGTRGAGNPERRGTHQSQQKRKQIEANGTKDAGKSDVNVTAPKSTNKLHLVNGAAQESNSTASVLYEVQPKANNKMKDQPVDKTPTTRPPSSSSSLAPPKQEYEAADEDGGGAEPRINPDDLLELQERITKEILNSKLKETEMLELQVRKALATQLLLLLIINVLNL